MLHKSAEVQTAHSTGRRNTLLQEKRRGPYRRQNSRATEPQPWQTTSVRHVESNPGRFENPKMRHHPCALVLRGRRALDHLLQPPAARRRSSRSTARRGLFQRNQNRSPSAGRRLKQPEICPRDREQLTISLSDRPELCSATC